jgi:hypothetical protein
MENVPQRIAAAGAAVTVVGLATWVSWLSTGDDALVKVFFLYPNTLFSIAITFVEVLLCFEAWRRFEPTDAMRTPWLWLSLAAVAHFSGRTLSSVGVGEPARILGGPLQMSLLLAGLLNVLAVCRRLRLLRRLQPIDFVLLAIVCGFLIRTGFGVSAYIGAGKIVSFTTAVMWTSDPLLLLLLATAVLIRRAIAPLGFGLLANCWRSYLVGIVLTSLGSASAWCVDCTVTPIWTSLGWYVWLVADCAFALGPAFQVAALEHARSRARVFNAFSDLAFWRVP